MTYRAPVADIAFALKHAAGLNVALAEGLYGDLDEETVDSVLLEAGRFTSDVIAPLNRVGDTFGTPFKDGAVTTPPGWKQAYTAWAAAGWNGLAAPADWGGQDLPLAVNAACIEMWNSGSMAFGIGPALTMAGVDALAAYGTDELKRQYLGKLVSGEWMGTMQLTESQAGSDVGALRSKAERAPDGSYRLTGSKIFITYGEHDLTSNIIHFVLARLPDAPPGTKGVSLFLVPKVMLNEDGTLGKRNDVRAHSVEHKLGIHGSPTCTMIYGDQGGAIGYLIGEEHKGMLCMFTMMNRTRLAVGLQGVAIAELATQQALSYARERKQGAGGAIIHYPDVKRMLLTMRALTGAAQHDRDARIASIYEGTNGIQAIDLVTRKVPLAGGNTVRLYLGELRETVKAVQASNAPAFGETATRLGEAIDSLERTTQWLLSQKTSDTTLAGATTILTSPAAFASSALSGRP